MHLLSVAELVDVENHAWEEIRELLSQGSRTYRLEAAEPEAAAQTLVRLQVSTKSYLGAIAYETGGIVFEQGWITLLGAGAEGSSEAWPPGMACLQQMIFLPCRGC